MITDVCNIIVVIAFVAAGVWLGVNAIRTRRELVVLRSVKTFRKTRRRPLAAGAKPDLLWLLEQHEKRDLLAPAPVLEKWLGSKPVSEVGAYDAAYYAGSALQEKSWKNFNSLLGATGGSALMGAFAASWLPTRHPESTSTNLLSGMGESGLTFAMNDWPLLASMLLLAWSWREKERADQLGVEAEILEAHARNCYARENGSEKESNAETGSRL